MNTVGIGTRILNFLIDTLIIFVITFIVFKIRNWYVLYYHVRYFNFGWFFLGVLFIYYAIFEMLFARTPGKWFSYTKVVDRNGNKPSITAILIRSFVRMILIDMFFIPFLDKPLHDYISKTEVVEVS
jgi:uncharacterized RDD family membrane protein YckC